MSSWKNGCMSVSFVFFIFFFAMDLLKGHIAAVPAVSLKFWWRNYVTNCKRCFGNFSLSVLALHTQALKYTLTWFIFGFVAVVNGLCIWKNVAAWELCGNHAKFPLAHLRVMGKTVTKNNKECAHPVLTSIILMFSLNLTHYFWIEMLHRKHKMTKGKIKK